MATKTQKKATLTKYRCPKCNTSIPISETAKYGDFETCSKCKSKYEYEDRHNDVVGHYMILVTEDWTELDYDD